VPALSEEKETRAVAWIVAPILWVITGGMMMVHFVSFALGATSAVLLGVGIFIPPVGIVNALIFLFIGQSLDVYF
jgi:hypothetical protein